MFARNGENAGGFAQGEGKIRVFFEGFSNDLERFFAKIDAFRTISLKNDAILNGFEQVGDTDYTDYTDWVK